MAEVKNEIVYLRHIIAAIDRIESHISRLSIADFMKSELAQDAVIRQIEILGEAAKHISEDTRARCPGIPWKIMAGMRDKMIHNYFNVDLALVWEAASVDIPELKPMMLQVLSVVGGNLSLPNKV